MKKVILLLTLLLFGMHSFAQFDVLKKAAEAGDIDAQKFIAQSYLEGKNGANKNVQEALRWIVAAAKQGDAEAQYSAYLLGHEIGLNEDNYDEFIKYLEDSANQGYAPALTNYGYLLQYQAQNLSGAFKCYLDAAKQEYTQSYVLLADCFYYGYGTERNLSEAKKYYRAAIEAGYDRCFLGLAYCAQVENEYALAKDYFQKAMDAGVPQAYNDMGYMYAQGKGVKKDMKEAHRLVDIAISMDTSNADFLDSKGEFFLIENKAKEAAEIWNLIKSINQEYALNEDSYFCNTMRSYMDGSVDFNIATTSTVNENTFVVVIANETYRREAAVPYAMNDGKIFAAYCRQTLGIPETNIHFVENATLNDMKYHLNWLKRVVDVHGASAKAIVYYAGHGIPDERAKTAYLLPVDGYGSDINTGYNLKELYDMLGALQAQSVTVLLDACFSGSKREGDMLNAARGVAIKVRTTEPVGKVVVLSAAQGDETAYSYKEQQHGMFTYFVLKKLQETKGDVSLSELSNYVTEQVRKKSALTGKLQTPTVTPSAALGNTWKEWRWK